MDLYFTDFYGVSEEVLADYGAFNISLLTDLPLFIDPFLLFSSDKPEYQDLHEQIIEYLRFLRDMSVRGIADEGLLRSWYCFPEVKQAWLGFSEVGNAGRGLGMGFARALNKNLTRIFRSFGGEKITRASHLEKLCLIEAGVGRDMMSDFTGNLIKGYLLDYTATFAETHIPSSLTRRFGIRRAHFDYELSNWVPDYYTLPALGGEYVLLTPRDMLTRDETWINRRDLFDRFEEIPEAIDDEQLRANINRYFLTRLPQEPTENDRRRAKAQTLRQFPELIDYFIKHKEDHSEDAVRASREKVSECEGMYVEHFRRLPDLLYRRTAFYEVRGNTAEEARSRIQYLKDVVENKGGWRIFYLGEKPVRREQDLHILYRLVWYATPSDVSREVNDGRGPVDFKISRGSGDKTLVEFKLASNPHLESNLRKQVEVYRAASDAATGFKVIFFFTEGELARVQAILQRLKMEQDPHVILVDARSDNKPSGSRA